MRRPVALLATLLTLALPTAAAAHHAELPSETETVTGALPGVSDPNPTVGTTNVLSTGMQHLATLQRPFAGRTDTPAGSDLAFQGNLLVQGIYDRPGGIRLVDVKDPANPRILGDANCPGSQADVSIWGDLVFMSVDSARSAPECGAPAAPTAQFTTGDAYEGIRIFSIEDRANPRQIGFVNTDCGSHTHTLLPDTANDRLLIYVSSYPLGTPAENCSVASHRKISVVEVPLSDPASARVVSTPDVSPAIGCHDITVFPARDVAAAACLTESQMWDISDPVNPRVVGRIRNPAMEIHHSSAFAWDGRTLVLGDEQGGAIAAPGCLDPHLPLGSMWFYDVSDPANPTLKGRYNLPDERQRQADVLCTAHNFNPVPLRDGRDVLVGSWYHGGTTVLDFTDPARPHQLGFAILRDGIRGTPWSSYWYNGYIYSNNFDASYVPSDPRSRGLDVLRFSDPAVRGAARLGRVNPQTQVGFATD